MTNEPKSREEIKAEIAGLINSRIVAGDADSGVVLVTTLLSLVVPVLEDIAKQLKYIDSALAPDRLGESVAGNLRAILNFLDGSELRPVLRQMLKEKGGSIYD
jgi:hypothetical protein